MLPSFNGEKGWQIFAFNAQKKWGLIALTSQDYQLKKIQRTVSIPSSFAKAADQFR